MIRIAGMQLESVVDGYGIRNTIFTQGCRHHCKGCHNPETWPVNAGKLFDYDQQMKFINNSKENPLIDGLTLSGGDPIVQAHEVLKFIKLYKKEIPHHNIWLYTGYTYEELISMNDEDINGILDMIDVLVDGKFVLELRSLDCIFRGSTNQRIIDMNKTKNGNVILLKEK